MKFQFGREAKISALVIAALTLLFMPLLLVMWPSNGPVDLPNGGKVEYVKGEVLSVDDSLCESWVDPEVYCGSIEVELANASVEAGIDRIGHTAGVKHGDEIIVRGYASPDSNGPVYSFHSKDRVPLVLAVILASIAIVSLVIGSKGAKAISCLILSAIFIWSFMVPGIQQGGNPFLYGMVTSIALLTFVLYFTHGLNLKTTSALFGTICGVSLSLLAGWGATELLGLTGMDELTSTYTFANADINVSLLSMSALLIALIGILNDITVAQASTVWSISEYEQDRRRVYRKSLEVGKDHASSGIYTVAFSVVGGSMALLIVSRSNNMPVQALIQDEAILSVIVQALAGIVGLALTMPVTTLIASKMKGMVKDG